MFSNVNWEPVNIPTVNFLIDNVVQFLPVVFVLYDMTWALSLQT